MTPRFNFLPLLWLAIISVAPLTAHATVTNFFEGFEAGLTNWTVGDGNTGGTPAYWGVVDSAFGGEGTHGGSAKAYCAGTGYADTAGNPKYRDGMAAYLSRTVNLAGYTNATLSFWYKAPSIETIFDSASVMMGTTEIWFTDQPQANWTLVNLSLEVFIESTQTLTFTFTSDNSVTEEGWYLDDITLTDAATVTPPPNDNFDSARAITGAEGSAGANNRGATSELAELDPGNSIWFRWTPYTNGAVTFRTGGSAFDTLLCAYTGNALSSLARTGCDDNGDTNGASTLSFNAVAGTTYSFSVRGANGASGFVLLSWQQPNGLGVDLLPDLIVWANTANNYLYGWYLDQNEPTRPGRTLMRLSTATPNIGAGPLELRGTSAASGVYQRIFRADGSYYERFAGNFTFHPGHGHLHFDNWINLHLRAVLTNDGVGGIVASGDKTSFAIIDLTAYDLTLSNSSPISVYQGGLVQGLSVGWADVYSAGLPDQWIDVTGVPSGRYWLEAIVDPANSILESNETNNTARILINYAVPVPPSSQPPPNDHFTNALIFTGITGGDIGHNRNATSETNEPQHIVGNSMSRSAWWRWTAPSNMPAIVTTDGSSFDTVLAVYTGTNVANLTLIAADDDAGIGNNSLVTFAATGGVTYQIAVDGINGANGKIELNVNRAFNDAFTNCITLTGLVGATSGSTRRATRQPGEPLHAGTNGSGSIWFCWAAPTNTLVTFDTTGSSFDTLLGIYTGPAVNALTSIASDNNSGGSNGASHVTFAAISNTTYFLAVDGVPGATGVVKLAWSGPLPPTIIQQPASTNAPAGAPIVFGAIASGTAPLSYQWRHQGTNLTDSASISGSTTAVLALNKIIPANLGQYTLVVSNAYGSVTSAPANLIVLDNPRVIFAEETSGHSRAFVRVPIEMQSVGNEHALSFSVVFDPLILSNPRATNLPVGATLQLNTNQIASGALGVTLALDVGATFLPGHLSLLDLIFDTAPATNHVETYAGFAAAPVARSVTDTNGTALTTLFVAGVVDLETLRLTTGAFSNGVFRLTFSAVESQHYAIDASEDLVTWTAIVTNTPGSGLSEFIESTSLPHRFYKIRLVP